LLRLIGGSEAILKHVIFCHQSESCWPIDRKDRELKERFDEIFGTVPYRTAREQLQEYSSSLGRSIEAHQATLLVLEKKRGKREQRKHKLNELQDQYMRSASPIYAGRRRGCPRFKIAKLGMNRSKNWTIEYGNMKAVSKVSVKPEMSIPTVVRSNLTLRMRSS
jgi:DNA repair exonuclease SbcCD ATPase subunit